MANEKGRDSDGKSGRTSKRSTTIDLTAVEVAREAAERAAEEAKAGGAAAEPETPDTVVTASGATPETLEGETPAAASPADSSLTDAASGTDASSGAPAEAVSADQATSDVRASGTSASEAASSDTPATASENRVPPAATPASRASEHRGAGIGAMLAAACIGGVVVLGGVYGLGNAGLLPGLGADDSKADAATVEALDRRLAALDAAVARPDEATTTRITELETALNDARAAIEASGTAASDAAREALDKLGAAIAAETAAREALAGDLTATSEALAAAKTEGEATSRSLGELAATVEALPKEDLAPALETLTSRVAAYGTRLGLVDGTVNDLSASTAGLKAAQDEIAAAQTTLGERISAIESRLGELDGLRSDLDGLSKTVETGISGLDGRMAEAETKLGELGSTSQAIDGRVGEVEGILERAPEEGEIAALSLAVTTLAGKVERGAPFSAELAAIKAAARDLPGIEALEPFAETGIPTALAVMGGFPSDAVMKSEGVAADAAPMDRLMAGARSLVNFRETGAGESLGAIVSDIEAKLEAGDLPAAGEAWNRLPEPAKAASSDWKAGLDARLAADASIATLTDRMIERLSVTVNKS
ncbi:hypothetical protein [Methylobrevis pamukkalensis]|uniref:Chromosome partition protein Smc n=1 Tax=Methylobrevis pamukkalensis TaxID=1439726 RepID=A0A1E3H4F8_9HYPH|nr:hypothetical protein [Methylobrevis pamukkalensis]ODN70401.1 Chromosome partition protein Smc [Methylobrevis pamukkalensis]